MLVTLKDMMGIAEKEGIAIGEFTGNPDVCGVS